MTEYILYIFALGITPGPNCIASLENASRNAFPRCLTFNLGMAVGQTVVFSLCYFLISWFIVILPKAETVLHFVGNIYILWLAYCLVKSGKITVGKGSGDFKTGFLMQFINTKVFSLGITSISAYAIPMADSFECGWALTMMLPAVCTICHVTWALAGVSISRIYDRYRKILNIIFALILAFQGIKGIAGMVYQ